MTDVQVSERDREAALATGYAEGSRMYVVLAEAIAQARAEEREACANVCEDYDGEGVSYTGYDFQLGDGRRTASDCAAAIRARGEK